MTDAETKSEMRHFRRISDLISSMAKNGAYVNACDAGKRNQFVVMGYKMTAPFV